MTERFNPERPARQSLTLKASAGGLTSLGHNSTLRSEGSFMAEPGNGEGQVPKPPKQDVPPVEPESQQPKNIEQAPPQSVSQEPFDAEKFSKLSEDEKIQVWKQKNTFPWENTPIDIRGHFLRTGEFAGPGAMAAGLPADAETERGGYISTGEKIRLITDREFRDKYFNDFFALIDATPHEQFEGLFRSNWIRSQRYDEFVETLSRGAVGETSFHSTPEELAELVTAKRQMEMKADLVRFQAERRMRERLHDVNSVLYVPSVNAEQLFDYMQQFGSDLGDIALKTRGVVPMMDIYAQVLKEDMAKNNGYLRPEAVLGKVDTEEIEVEGKDGKPVRKKRIVSVERGEVEEEARRRFMKRLDKGQIFTRNQDGQAVQVQKDDFKQWELDKVFTVSRGMMVMTERLLTIAAESSLTKNKNQGETGKYSSLFLQDVLQGYSPFVHLIGKYSITDKGLFAYLFKDEKMKKVLGILSKWNPKELQEVKERFEENPLNILESDKELFYLMRLNPNRAGDIFTWLTWRANADFSVTSMLGDFIEKGRGRMEKRLKSFSLLDKDMKPMPEKDALNEYANWIGTGVRFEKLRGNLKKLEIPDGWDDNTVKPEDLKKRRKELWEMHMDKYKKQEEVGKDKKAKEEGEHVFEAMTEAEKIFDRMVNLQPHRLYLNSKDIRARINESIYKDFGFKLADGDKMLPSQKASISKVLDNFSIMERALLSSRERLLNKGKTFETVSLDEFYNLIEDERERKLTRKFANAFKKDYQDNKELYEDEFIYKREYKHGFVLWAEDAPMDEFNMSALGPTAAFARRARDNKFQFQASQAEIALLGKLKHIRTPDQLVEELEKVFEHISHYASDKAQEAIADKAEGFAKFFASEWQLKIPLYGPARRAIGQTSFARMAYDNAPSWSSTEVRYFLKLLKSKDLINKDQYKKVMKNVGGTNIDVGLEVGSTFLQLFILAYLMYLLEASYKGK